MVSESTGLVIHLKKHFLLLFNLMEEIISWEIGRTDLFLFGGGGWGGEANAGSNCRSLVLEICQPECPISRAWHGRRQPGEPGGGGGLFLDPGGRPL